MATQAMYDRIKQLSNSEIIKIAVECCGDGNRKNFCEKICPYLDVRAEERNPNRLCSKWLMHDLLKIISEERTDHYLEDNV